MMLLTLVYILSRLLKQAAFFFPIVLMVFNEPGRRNV